MGNQNSKPFKHSRSPSTSTASSSGSSCVRFAHMPGLTETPAFLGPNPFYPEEDPFDRSFREASTLRDRRAACASGTGWAPLSIDIAAANGILVHRRLHAGRGRTNTPYPYTETPTPLWTLGLTPDVQSDADTVEDEDDYEWHADIRPRRSLSPMYSSDDESYVGLHDVGNSPPHPAAQRARLARAALRRRLLNRPRTRPAIKLSLPRVPRRLQRRLMRHASPDVVLTEPLPTRTRALQRLRAHPLVSYCAQRTTSTFSLASLWAAVPWRWAVSASTSAAASADSLAVHVGGDLGGSGSAVFWGVLC